MQKPSFPQVKRTDFIKGGDDDAESPWLLPEIVPPYCENADGGKFNGNEDAKKAEGAEVADTDCSECGLKVPSPRVNQLCCNCGYYLCDKCFEEGKGRVIWSDENLCGTCDKRDSENIDGDEDGDF